MKLRTHINLGGHRVCMVYRSPDSGCGIATFQQHLVTAMRRHGIDAASCNVAFDTYNGSEVTLVHYSPAMWEGHTDLFDEVLARAVQGLVIIVLHSLQPPQVQEYLSEPRCRDIGCHLRAMLRANVVIVSLSASCTHCLESWETALSARTVTSAHPGLFVHTSPSAGAHPYAFFGGVIRPKKDPTSSAIRVLLESIQGVGVDVWVHSSNVSDLSAMPSALGVWRQTIGVMNDRQWSEAISLARAVLCPYNTQIQCVSGVIAEAISAGTNVIATSFPFALELAAAYPDYIYVENELAVWPRVVGRLGEGRLEPARIPSWSALLGAVEMAARIASNGRWRSNKAFQLTTR